MIFEELYRDLGDLDIDSDTSESSDFNDLAVKVVRSRKRMDEMVRRAATTTGNEWMSKELITTRMSSGDWRCIQVKYARLRVWWKGAMEN